MTIIFLSKFIYTFLSIQDGSCNGLQHYAAMGRDQLGGEAVNLTPSDKPRDTYTDFANYVNDLRVQDAAKGHVLARKLDGLITRKVCVD